MCFKRIFVFAFEEVGGVIKLHTQCNMISHIYLGVVSHSLLPEIDIMYEKEEEKNRASFHELLCRCSCLNLKEMLVWCIC